MIGEPLPKLANRGGNMLERKLISYFVWRTQYRFEWRMPDSMNFDPTLMPPLLGSFEFISFFELGIRLFMFENKIDRQKAIEFYYTHQKPKKERTKRVRRNRKRKSRSR